VALVVGFAVKLVMARKMTPEGMGVVLAAQSFVVLALALAALGVPDAIVRSVGREENRQTAPRRTVHRALAITTPATLLTVLVALATLGVWFAPRMTPDAMWATAIVILSLPLLGAGEVLGAAFRGINRLAMKLLLIDVARPAFLLVALLVSPMALTQHASYVAGLYALGAVVSAMLLWVLFARDERWTDMGATTARDLLQFGLPIAGSALIAGPLVNSILPLILTASAGPSAVALFAIALSFQGIIALPASVLEQAAIPAWSRMAARDAARDLSESYKRCATMGFALAASSGLVLLANDRALLTSIFGPTFGAARAALQWAVVATLFGAFTGPNDGMLHALGHAGSIFRARAASAVAGVAAGAMLIPQYGLAGAIAAFVVVALVINVLYAAMLYGASGIHWWSKPHATTTIIALAGLADVLWLREVFPASAWIIAHVLALLLLVANADVRSMVGGFLKAVTSGKAA
jgi:O-antigen/teichoic acid export membrane protein